MSADETPTDAPAGVTDTDAPAGVHPANEAPYALMRTLGYRSTYWGPDKALVEMDIDEDVHANRGGIPHGGVYATLLDTACAFAAAWREAPEPPARPITLSLTVNFVAIPKGRRLIAEGRVTGGGRKTFFSKGELRDELGNLVCTASATMAVRPGKPAS